MNQRGHSLMELTIVMIIVGVLAAAMMVNMQSQSLHKLSAAAERMASDIRYAQQFAISTGRFAQFDISNVNHYEVHWIVEGSSTENQVEDPHFPGQNFIVDFDDVGSPHEGVTFPFPNCQSLTVSEEDLQFNSFGVPLCCGNSNTPCEAMTSPYQVTLSYSGRTRTVTVERETGSVSVP